MPADTTPALLSGLFKQVYPKEVLTAVPEAAKLVKEVPFETRAMLGDKFHQPIVLVDEGGFTYAAPNAGNFDLGLAASMQSQDAQVDGYQTVLTSSIDYESAARSANGNQAAFLEATQLKVRNMVSSHRKRLEYSCWYGQTGLGTVSAVAAVDATHTLVTFSAASFAALIWAGKEGHAVVFYDPSTGAGNYTRIGTEPAAGSAGAYVIQSVNVQNRTITVTSSAADATSLVAITIANGILCFFRFSAQGSTSTFTHADMLGLDGQIIGTTTRFNINPALYNLWQGNTFDCGSASLTFKKAIDAVALAVNRGLDEDVEVWVNPVTWSNLLNDQAALRKYDASYTEKNIDQGAKKLTFHSINGLVTIIGHGVVKAGEGFVLPMGDDHIIRIGAWDVSFVNPGGGVNSSGGDIFYQDPNRAGMYFRAYSHQSIVLLTPAKAVKLTNIVNA